MVKRMDEGTKKIIIKMYKIGSHPREIVKAVPSFSYSTVEGYITAFKNGFKSYTEYLADRAKKRGWNSFRDIIYFIKSRKQNGYHS